MPASSRLGSDSFLATLESFSLPVYSPRRISRHSHQDWHHVAGHHHQKGHSHKKHKTIRTRSISPLSIITDDCPPGHVLVGETGTNPQLYTVSTICSRARSLSQPARLDTTSRWMLTGGKSSPANMEENGDKSRHPVIRRSRSRSKNHPDGTPRDPRDLSTGKARIIALKQYGSYFHADEFYTKKLNEILFSDSLSTMPNKPTKLLEHLYIGNYRDAKHPAYLNRIGITHVLNCAAGDTHNHHRQKSLTLHNDVNQSPYPRNTGILYYKPLDAEDTTSYNMSKHMEEAQHFIDDAKRRRGRAFVHCAMGVNRSGFICVAYLMLNRQMHLLEAFQLVRQKHGPVVCNRGFQKQLIVFARAHALLKPS